MFETQNSSIITCTQNRRVYVTAHSSIKNRLGSVLTSATISIRFHDCNKYSQLWKGQKVQVLCLSCIHNICGRTLKFYQTMYNESSLWCSLCAALKNLRISEFMHKWIRWFLSLTDRCEQQGKEEITYMKVDATTIQHTPKHNFTESPNHSNFMKDSIHPPIQRYNNRSERYKTILLFEKIFKRISIVHAITWHLHFTIFSSSICRLTIKWSEDIDNSWLINIDRCFEVRVSTAPCG